MNNTVSDIMNRRSIRKYKPEQISREELDKVYTPIGLDIKSETPEEIGVSIVAEIIRVRAEHNEAAAALKHAESMGKLHE